MGSGGLRQLGSRYCEVSLGAAAGQPPLWVTDWRQREHRGLGKSHNLEFQEVGLAHVPVAQGSKPEARLERVNEEVLGVLQGPGRNSML